MNRSGRKHFRYGRDNTDATRSDARRSTTTQRHKKKSIKFIMPFMDAWMTRTAAFMRTSFVATGNVKAISVPRGNSTMDRIMRFSNEYREMTGCQSIQRCALTRWRSGNAKSEHPPYTAVASSRSSKTFCSPISASLSGWVASRSQKMLVSGTISLHAHP